MAAAELEASCEVTSLLPAASNKRDLVVAVRPGTGLSGTRDSAGKGEHGAGRREVTSHGAGHRRLFFPRIAIRCRHH